MKRKTVNEKSLEKCFFTKKEYKILFSSFVDYVKKNNNIFMTKGSRKKSYFLNGSAITALHPPSPRA